MENRLEQPRIKAFEQFSEFRSSLINAMQMTFAADFFGKEANMAGSTDLRFLLKNATPRLNEGTYVFCCVASLDKLRFEDVLFSFKEEEGLTVVVSKEIADRLQLKYEFPAAWITLDVVSSLEAVGLTAAFSTALAQEGITCNVVAGFYHDHLFVKRTDADPAMKVLSGL